MMTCSIAFFNNISIGILFVTVGIGCIVGKMHIGPIRLGSVCGTLIIALLLGQTGCQSTGDIKEISFALFIFAMGYSGGPQFFANLNRASLRYLALPIIEAISVLGIVLIAVWFFKLDAGTAAGLAAGAATESAVVGTAAEALKHLELDSAEVARMQANIATAYTLTYLIGLISIVFFTSQVAPALLRINLRNASKELEQEMDVSAFETDDANTPSLPAVVGRAHVVKYANDKSVMTIEAELGGRAIISRIFRNGEPINPNLEDILHTGDIVVIVGWRSSTLRAISVIGPEILLPEGHTQDLQLIEKKVVIAKKQVSSISIRHLHDMMSAQTWRGIFFHSVERMGYALPLAPSTTLRCGDVLTLLGRDPELSEMVESLGSEVQRDGTTDLAFLCFGILIGLIIGSFSLHIGRIPISLGSGGGALVSGLICGWIHAKRPGFGHIPMPAIQLLKDLGLALFVACVGLSAGPQAITLIRQHGIILPLLGIIVSLGPACLSLWIGHKFLKIKGPLLIGAIAGQHVSTPSVSAIMTASGSSIPLLGYTVTYAIANVLLPVLGPLIVSLAHYIK